MTTEEHCQHHLLTFEQQRPHRAVASGRGDAFVYHSHPSQCAVASSRGAALDDFDDSVSTHAHGITSMATLWLAGLSVVMTLSSWYSMSSFMWCFIRERVQQGGVLNGRVPAGSGRACTLCM